MSKLKQQLKKVLFGMLGKDPEAIVVSFLTGDERQAAAMLEEIVRLEPRRRHYAVTLGEEVSCKSAERVALTPGSTWSLYRQLAARFRRFRIGLAPLLWTGDRRFSALRRAAFMLAPGKILAYNSRLERQHLKLSSALASLLFLRGVPLDRIHLRPWWLCPWKKDRTRRPEGRQVFDGRPLSASRRRIAILTPYVPYPLSHGGAVRIYHLLREIAKAYDVFLFAFQEQPGSEDLAPLLDLCAKVILVGKPRYREPRWSTIAPSEVAEYRSPAMRAALREFMKAYGIGLLQVEYTHLAEYGGDILVEHDVTFDLKRQVFERSRSVGSWWDYWRWLHFERRALQRYRKVVVMSGKDGAMLAARGIDRRKLAVIGNGVDLSRFRPEPETPGRRLLFVGSFRHFPNITAYRFFAEEVWPLLVAELPDVRLTVVAGPDPLLYWREQADSPEPAPDERIRLLGFVADVRPLYVETNVVVVPTLVSAGTNLKVLEAMAMERAVVSTSCGCAGLGLEHGRSVWIADSAQDFAAGVARLLSDEALRGRLAREAHRKAEENFDWGSLGARQRQVVEELLGPRFRLRRGRAGDVERMSAIQSVSPEAAQWPPERYLEHDVQVAESDGQAVGFLVSRRTAPGEYEILNLVVAPDCRRQGVASGLLADALRRLRGTVYLEVRESNQAARRLYEKFGFVEAGRRPGYYRNPEEGAIVMKLYSC